MYKSHGVPSRGLRSADQMAPAASPMNAQINTRMTMLHGCTPSPDLRTDTESPADLAPGGQGLAWSESKYVDPLDNAAGMINEPHADRGDGRSCGTVLP